MSNYKGFPTRQRTDLVEPRERLDSHLSDRNRAGYFTASLSWCVLSSRCGRTNYNRSSCSPVVLRTPMEDARGGLIR